MANDREVLKTLSLSKPLHEAGEEILELEFYDPTSAIFDKLEIAQEKNAKAKKDRDYRPTGLVVLEDLTGLDSSALKNLTFGDRFKAQEIAGEIMGATLGTGEE